VLFKETHFAENLTFKRWIQCRRRIWTANNIRRSNGVDWRFW